MNALDRLISLLCRLPGIGSKSAARIAYYLLKADPVYAEALSSAINDVKRKIKKCVECGNYTDANPCNICSDDNRDRTILCIVESPQDIHVLESTKEFYGIYHVLGGVLSPLNGVGPEDLNLSSLSTRIKKHDIKEIILATNPTVEGDTTAMYIQQLFEPLNISVTRLALGLPVGGDLEYADRLTLARSIKDRIKF
jgi:recombination protein RecR